MKFGNYPEIDLSQIKAIEELPNGYILHFLDGSKMDMDVFTSIELMDAWARDKFNQE